MQKYTCQDYSIEINNIIEDDNAGSDGVVLLYVLKGCLSVKNGEQQQRLSADSLFILNKNESYQLNGITENIVVNLVISYRYFSRYYTNYAAASFTLERQKNKLFHKMLRELLTRLAISQFQGNKETSLLEINGLLTNILSILILHFKEEKTHSYLPDKQYSARIENTLNYIKDNYDKPLSLALLAKINHTSLSYFSRLFTREVGLSFKTYLTQMRFMQCLEALANSSKPLYQIVDENGFTGTRNFTALFKAQYGLTPHQYREQCRTGNPPEFLVSDIPALPLPLRPARFGLVDSVELLALLANSLSLHEDITHFERFPTKSLTISVDETSQLPNLPHQSSIVRIGKLEEVLKIQVQQQIALIKQQMPLRYIQIEQILSDTTFPLVPTTDENNPTFSTYYNADKAVELLKNQGVALLFSLYFQPTEEKMRSCISRFLDFIAHSIAQFGADWVNTWAFIYHPDTEQIEASTARFQKLNNTIKKILPDFKTGLFYPFPAGKEALARLPFFSSELAKQLDFIGFDANANAPVNRESIQKEDFDSAERFVQQHSQNIAAQLKKHGLNLPLYLHTWNTLTGNTRHTNGCFFRGALLMETLLSLPEQVVSVGFWINSQVQNEALENNRIDTSSLALFYTYNTRRPVFHVLSLRERLMGDVLAKGPHYLITHSRQGYRVLLTNSVTYNPSLSLQQQLVVGFRRQVDVVINGMEKGTYQIKKHLFDQQHGALYHQFECQPTRYGRDSEVMQFIDLHSAPDLHIYDEDIASRWETCVEMDVNALCLFELNRIWIP